MNINDKISILPDAPGVYRFYDKRDRLLYIGKAKNLKKRVKSYFIKDQESFKTHLLVSKIADVRFVVVDTEIDALLLENNLIKQYQPPFNVLLKDDKSYPWICIKNEEFSRVFYTRRVIKDKSLYFGPYTSFNTVRTLLGFFKQLYPLRTCSYELSQEKINAGKYKVCLEYHIKNCKAPCIGEYTKEEYDSDIANIKKILKGRVGEVANFYKQKMKKYSEEYRFEEAQIVKEKLKAIQDYQSKSTIVSVTISNVDVFGCVDDVSSVFVNYLKIVNGAIIHVYNLEIKKKIEEPLGELLSAVIVDIRQKFNSDSRIIVTCVDVDFKEQQVEYRIPQKGDLLKLLKLSEKNAKYFRLDKIKQIEKTNPEKNTERRLMTLKKDLQLTELPKHIECFDNSNFQGSYPVASCVVFRNTKPAKKEYRHFNIKTVEGVDDFASMKEVVGRRYHRLVEEEKQLPQLVVVDGGKGQLSAAVEALKELNLYGKIGIIGIAKKLEEIYFPGDSVPLYIDKNSESLKIIQQLRNEAHRFGITFHKKKRSNDFIKSELRNIDGVGEKSEQKLLNKFKSVKRIKKLSIEELSKAINPKLATKIHHYFHSNDKNIE